MRERAGRPIERFFREITQKRIRRGSFENVRVLIEAITSFIKAHNANPRPFIWTANVEDILAKIRRAGAVLNKMPSV